MGQPEDGFGLGQSDMGPAVQSLGLIPPIDTGKPLPKVEVPETSLGHHQAARRREMLKVKNQRAPAAQRKRTKLSCDYCKTRRRKCQRFEHATAIDGGGQPGMDEEGLAPCKLCVEADIPCMTTMRRKQRIYGCVESLDRRYRMLDALVQGLHPQLSSEATAEELVAYGSEIGVDMTDVSPESCNSKQTFNTTPPRSIGASAIISLTSFESKKCRCESSDDNESLVRDSNSRPHYIGPSGSLAFSMKLKGLVANLSKGIGAKDSEPTQTISSELLGAPIMGSIYGKMDTEKSTCAMPSVVSGQEHFRDDPPATQAMEGGDWQNCSAEQLLNCVPVHKVKLPVREESDTYIEAFFCHVHPSFLIFHRPTFQSVYEEIWRTVGMPSDNHGTHVSASWLCCLYMVYVLGSQSISQKEQSLEFQRSYYDEAKDLPQLLTRLSLPNVSALMLLSLYSDHTNDQTSAWTFQGIACRLAVALGMHRKNISAAFHPITRELRKRVWWTLYTYEQSLCCVLDRPAAIDDREVDVEYPDEQVLLCAYGQPPRLVEHLSQLWSLVGCIRRDLSDPLHYSASRCSQAFQYLYHLLKWHTNVPPELMPTAVNQRRTDSKWRAMILMEVTYQCALGLLTRCFLLSEVEASEKGQKLGPEAYLIAQFGKVCVTSALRCVSLLMKLWRGNCFNGVLWLDTYWAYLASMEITLQLVSPNSGASWDDPPRAARQTWRFEPRNSQQQTPQSDLDHDLETLVAENHLVEHHSIADLTKAVRQVHNILKTVEVSDTNARFAKIAADFAKTIGLVNSKPTLPLFDGHMVMGLGTVHGNESRANMPSMRQQPPIRGSMGTQLDNLGGSNTPVFYVQQQQQQQPLPPQFPEGIPYTKDASFVYSGIYNPTFPTTDLAVTQLPDIQWDTALAPEK